MLTRNRPIFAARAISCFLAQTYSNPNRSLVVIDSGDPGRSISDLPSLEHARRIGQVSYEYVGPAIDPKRVGLGALRNLACLAAGEAAILAIWDDDDWSHPLRLERQVAALDDDRKVITGYSSMHFIDERARRAWVYRATDPGYSIPTSLCFKREWWERNRFPSSFAHDDDNQFLAKAPIAARNVSPANNMMFASIHTGNSSFKDTSCVEYTEVRWEEVAESFPLAL